MKKIVAAGAVAAALLVGTSAPASAAPPVTAIGQKCDTYHKETHWLNGYGTQYTYRLAAAGDQYARCVYRVNKYEWIALYKLGESNYTWSQPKRPSGGR